MKCAQQPRIAWSVNLSSCREYHPMEFLSAVVLWSLWCFFLERLMLRWSGWGTRLLHIWETVGRNLALNILWGEMFGKYLIEQSGAEGKICWLGLGWNFLDNIITTSNTSMDQNNNFIFVLPPLDLNFSKSNRNTTIFNCDPVVC